MNKDSELFRMPFSLNPVRWLTPTRLYWFGSGEQPTDLLERWRDVPAQDFDIGQGEWRHDHHKHTLAAQADAALFERAADRIMRYQFYPPSVMQHASDAERAGRWLRPGDHIVQGIHMADVLTMNVVTEVVDLPERKGFTYATTEQHSEQGIWSVVVERQPGGALALDMVAVSRPRERESRLIRPYMRYLQRRAHRLGMRAFAASLGVLGL